jgi:peroxin-1
VKEIMELSNKYSFLFKNNPKMLNSGILLYGPTGCGKTYIASAVAKEFKINFISVKGPEMLDKYIGSSEAKVREVFERANQCKPCVLFFDEFDSLVPMRGNGSTSVTDRIVNQFLTYLDGVESTRENIVIIAATS